MADAIFTGGSEAVINQTGLAAFGNIMALSERNDSPETASRPFDRDRDGFVLSEGAGVLCLEELEHAKRRGATIYAELTGYGFTCDAHDLVAPHPESRGSAQAMQNALDMAHLNSGQIDLINCHAASKSTRLLYDSSLPCNCSAPPMPTVPSRFGHVKPASTTILLTRQRNFSLRKAP